MTEGAYGQFCPVAKGAEIVATRWTPLILRELMCGETSFNDIHRGVPRISRSLLAERLRQLEADGIVAKAPRNGGGHVWRLTQAGEGLREVIEAVGRWGLIYGRQKVTRDDFDSTVLMWALRRRVDRELLPDRRIVIRFDLSGVARCKTALSLHWLVLERKAVDVCLKDPGFAIDGVVTGAIAALVDVYLGHLTWREATRTALAVDAPREIAVNLDRWLRLDKVVGRDLPIVPPMAA